MLILLSGLMIGSSLFAVPKKRETGNNNSCSPYDMGLMMYKWLWARPTEGAKAEYYSRMETEALRCMPIRGRYDRLIKFEEYVVDFPLTKKVSKTFLSLLKHYLPTRCAGAKRWRKMIVACVREFRSG